MNVGDLRGFQDSRLPTNYMTPTATGSTGRVLLTALGLAALLAWMRTGDTTAEPPVPREPVCCPYDESMPEH